MSSCELFYYTSSDIPVSLVSLLPATLGVKWNQGMEVSVTETGENRLGIFHTGETGKGMICI